MFKRLLSVLLILSPFLGCQKANLKPNLDYTIKEFGKMGYMYDYPNFELELKQYKSYSQLLSKVEEIACSGNTPKLIIPIANEQFAVYLNNICWEYVLCILWKERNIVRIDTDSVYKNFKAYPLSKLKSVLEKDLSNFGVLNNHSENPQKLTVFISCSEKNFSK